MEYLRLNQNLFYELVQHPANIIYWSLNIGIELKEHIYLSTYSFCFENVGLRYNCANLPSVLKIMIFLLLCDLSSPDTPGLGIPFLYSYVDVVITLWIPWVPTMVFLPYFYTIFKRFIINVKQKYCHCLFYLNYLHSMICAYSLCAIQMAQNDLNVLSITCIYCGCIISELKLCKLHLYMSYL